MTEARYYDVRGLRLAYYTWGERSRPALVFLHGFLDHGLSFAPVCEALADRFYCVALDFRGFGRSGWIGAGGYYHFQDYYVDVRALLKQLSLERCSFVGHSMGGTVALVVAASLGDTVESLVLLEGLGPPPEDLAGAPARNSRWSTVLLRDQYLLSREDRKGSRRTIPSVEYAAERLRELNPRITESRAMAMATQRTERQPDGALVWRYDPLHRTPSARPFNVEEFKTHLRAVTQPVFALYGSLSDFPASDLSSRHECLRDLRCAEVENAAHNIHHSRPKRVVAAIEHWFLDRTGPLPEGLVSVAGNRT